MKCTECEHYNSLLGVCGLTNQRTFNSLGECKVNFLTQKEFLKLNQDKIDNAKYELTKIPIVNENGEVEYKEIMAKMVIFKSEDYSSNLPADTFVTLELGGEKGVNK